MQKIATKLVKIMDELAEGKKQKSKSWVILLKAPMGMYWGQLMNY